MMLTVAQFVTAHVSPLAVIALQIAMLALAVGIIERVQGRDR